MIKCEVIENFNLKDFAKLKNIQRVAKNVEGKLFVGDKFECDEAMADYLTGNNVLNKVVVKVIEVVAKNEPTIKEAKIVDDLDEVLEEEIKETKKSKSSKRKAM